MMLRPASWSEVKVYTRACGQVLGQVGAADVAWERGTEGVFGHGWSPGSEVLRGKTGGPHGDLGKVAGDCAGLAPDDVAVAWVAGDGIPNDIQALAADLDDGELSNKGSGIIPGDELWGGLTGKVDGDIAVGAALSESAADGPGSAFRIRGDVGCYDPSEHDQFVREGRLAGVGQLRSALGISARCAASSGPATGPSYSRSFVRTR